MLTGKTALVTGATSGVGFGIAYELANQNAHVILVGRNTRRAEAARHQITAGTNNGRVEVLLADLSLQSDVRQLARTFQSQYDRLHILVNNVGGFFPRYQKTPEGIEQTLALNHLSGFLLTHLLHEQLQHAADFQGEARIVMIASEDHRCHHLNLDDLQYQQIPYDGFQAYANSKLMNLLMMRTLAKRLNRITVNAVHPGFVRSRLWRQDTSWRGLAKSLVQPLAASARAGARTPYWMASHPQMKGVTGQYFRNQQAIQAHADVYDDALQAQLWHISQRLTELA